MNPRKWALAAFVPIALMPTTASAERVIVKCTRPCTGAVQAVSQAGGTLTHRYKYIDAIAADVPSDRLNIVRAVVGPAAVRKDAIVEQPTVARDRNGARLAAEIDAEGEAAALDAAAIATLASEQPDAYLINNPLMNLSALHAGGKLGDGIRVAVIDSGIRPQFPHLTVGGDNSVIGGEDFVGDGMGFSNVNNGGHGTFVAGMISANVIFTFNPASILVAAANAYCPGCIINGNQVPMIGSAPLSEIYALRVFGPTGGAPESRIIAAMERVLELRENFDNGMPETFDASGRATALNIKVCNMSLGGPTLHAGRDLEDQLTQAFLDRDIVLVTSASNAGPSGSTVGSPGTGFGSLTVAAASTPQHERILRVIQFGATLGVGVGQAYRPFEGIQTADFSSRGPSADGRTDIALIANGLGSFGQGLSGGAGTVGFASGTSFSSPSVAGVAAVLREAVPSARAAQVRNAIIMSADPTLLGDGSTVLDQGAGFVDAAAAYAILAGGAPDLPGAAGGDSVHVKVNLTQGAGVKTYDGNVTRSANLLPGERLDTYYRVSPNTSAVVVTLGNVTPGAVQNPLFGDDVLLTVHSPKTSAHGEGDYKLAAFTTGGTWVFPRPETGLMRVTVNGSTTNASPVGATVNIYSVTDPLPLMTAHGKIQDGEQRVLSFEVPAGAKSLNARLEWNGDWSSYPTNDLDVVLVAPAGAPNFAGATLSSPETATIANPAPGQWFAVVDGFSVATRGGDNFKLRLEIDGVVVR